MQLFTRSLGVMMFAAVCGCASQATLNTSAEAERSFDGLYPFDNTIVDRAWARADLDLSVYSKIKVEGAGIRFRPTSAAANSRLALVRANETDFPINEKDRERLRTTVAAAFVKELEKLERFELTEDTGPDVLIVRGALLDVVSNVPKNVSARMDIYLESVGEATLLIELIDSESGAVLLRAADRRSAERQSMAFASNSVSNWLEVKRLAQFWARLLRERLDELAEAMTLSESAL